MKREEKRVVLVGKKLSAGHLKKALVSRLEEALQAAQKLANYNSLPVHKSIRQGLEYFIHNTKARL